MNEIFYALFGKIWFGKFFIAKMEFFAEGTPTSVLFDYTQVSKKINQGHNLIGFYHTHPNMPAYMSNVDIPTFDTWVTSEGKTLYSLVHGYDGIKTFKCYNDDKYNFHCSEIECECSMFGFFGHNYILGIINETI